MEQGVHVGVGKATKNGGAGTIPATKKASSDAKPAKVVISNEFVDETIRSETAIYSVTTFAPQLSNGGEFLIRALDVVGSIMILVLTMPAMVVISLLIKVFSPGLVLYKQKRVGKDGEVFTLYKFRTMINNAEKHTGPVWATKGDSRVTSIGRVLRRTRLDELPQLFNVLRGDMSLVGPRPERPYFVKRHNVLQGVRLTIRPGLTGLAQIRSYYDLKPHNKMRYDYLYIQRRSLLLNIYLLLKTIPIIFCKKGW